MGRRMGSLSGKAEKLLLQKRRVRILRADFGHCRGCHHRSIFDSLENLADYYFRLDDLRRVPFVYGVRVAENKKGCPNRTSFDYAKISDLRLLL